MRRFYISAAAHIPNEPIMFVAVDLSTDGGLTAELINRAHDVLAGEYGPPFEIVILAVTELED